MVPLAGILSVFCEPMKISRILHAGYVFHSGDARIVFDPIFENPFSRNCQAFPAVEFDTEMIAKQTFDAVFISHYHEDHCSLESLDLIRRETPIYLYSLHDLIFELLESMGFTQVHRLQLDEAVVLGPFRITPLRALDVEVDSIFHIEAEGLHVLNVVDAWIDLEMRARLQKTAWDLVLWPFQTMREIEILSPAFATASDGRLPAEWHDPLKALHPRAIVPSSCQFKFEEWSWLNRAFFPISYASFGRQVTEILPATRVIRLDPGMAIDLSRDPIVAAEGLAWVRNLGAAGEDYQYNPEAPIPSTAEIAQKLPRPTAVQLERVANELRQALPARYRELGPPADPYFQAERLWKISVYDGDGVATCFHYRLKEEQMELLERTPSRPDWTTEIPALTFWRALVEGDSLTSLYIRLHEGDFTPQTERRLREADVLEDPLLRCLFNGVFGSYQKAQLARLRAR